MYTTLSLSLYNKSLTITLGNFGTELCEVYTVAQHLPFNSRNNFTFKDGSLIAQWCINISTRQPLMKSSNTNIPIILFPDKSFKVFSQHEPIFANSAQLQDFSDYIQSMSQWINLLIRNYTVHPSSDSLIFYIINQTQLLVSTDCSRTHNKSGGSWIIVLTDGTKLISGHNPEFVRHVDINSYHSEIYASLSSLTFL